MAVRFDVSVRGFNRRVTVGRLEGGRLEPVSSSASASAARGVRGRRRRQLRLRRGKVSERVTRVVGVSLVRGHPGKDVVLVRHHPLKGASSRRGRGGVLAGLSGGVGRGVGELRVSLALKVRDPRRLGGFRLGHGSDLVRLRSRGVLGGSLRPGRGGHGQALVQEERVAVVVVIALLVRVEDDEREAVARATGQRDLDGVAVSPKRGAHRGADRPRLDAVGPGGHDSLRRTLPRGVTQRAGMLLALLAQPPVQEQIAGHVRRDDCDEVVNVRGRSLDAHGDVRAGRDVLELHPERLLGELEVRGDLGVSERAVERTRRGTPRRSSRLQKSTLARFSRRGVEARAGRGGRRARADYRASHRHRADSGPLDHCRSHRDG